MTTPFLSLLFALNQSFFKLKQNGASTEETLPSYSAFSEPCSIEPVSFLQFSL